MHTTQSDFPPNVIVLEAAETVVLRVLVSFARVWGGMMSRRAVRRSVRDSSKEERSATSEESEISESVVVLSALGTEKRIVRA